MSGWQQIIGAVTLLCGALVVYHHLIFPWLLRWAVQRRPRPVANPAPRGFRAGPQDTTLPSVTLVVPACDEAAVIADKIRNLATLDYPANRLRVIIACDGCSDDTAQRARAAHAEPECAHLQLEVREFTLNRGKVGVLNTVLPTLKSDLIALSDTSALISVDALLVAAHHFADPGVGVVAGTYRLLDPGSEGEAAYWRYQTSVKLGEAALGAPLGVHGAFYMLRAALFETLPADTINDDFMLPMAIVARGYRAVYEPEMAALELERASASLDQRRRRRIAAGNLQQAWRMRHLLHPRHGGIAFAFASGKALRAVMPFLLLALLAGSLVLAPASPLFALLVAGQLAAYALALRHQRNPARPAPRLQALIHYLVSGHWAGLIGGLRYLAGLERGRWSRATHTERNST